MNRTHRLYPKQCTSVCREHETHTWSFACWRCHTPARTDDEIEAAMRKTEAGATKASGSTTKKILTEIEQSPGRKAKLDEIGHDLTVAVGKAADELHEVLMGNANDVERKHFASIMLRNHLERVVDKALSAKAAERGPILP